MAKPWLTTAGRVVVDAQGRVVLCDDCPCEEEEPVLCCTGRTVTLYARFSNTAGDCACLEGLCIALNQIAPPDPDWRSVVELSECENDDVGFRVYCEVIDGELRVVGEGQCGSDQFNSIFTGYMSQDGGATFVLTPTGSCGPPVNLVFSNVEAFLVIVLPGDTACCTGTFTVTVSETPC